MIEVPLTIFTPVAEVLPNFTVAPERKPVPVMVTAAPPEVVPVVGEIAVTVGAGFEPELPKRTNAATDGTPLLLIRNSM